MVKKRTLKSTIFVISGKVIQTRKGKIKRKGKGQKQKIIEGTQSGYLIGRKKNLEVPDNWKEKTCLKGRIRRYLNYFGGKSTLTRRNAWIEEKDCLYDIINKTKRIK